MKITWKENPLATVIELDAADRRVLKLRLEIEDLTDRISSARISLSPEWHKDYKINDAVISALRHLDIPDGDARLDGRLALFETGLASTHCGDCTCIPSSCMKCYAEHLLGVDTIAGLGKHEGSKIAGVFAAKSASISEVLDSLNNYHPIKGPAWDKFSDEEFQQHVPRWIAEARNAHTWLSAYEQTHFSDRSTSA